MQALGLTRIVKVHWLPGNRGVEGNEEANALAKVEASLVWTRQKALQGDKSQRNSSTYPTCVPMVFCKEVRVRLRRIGNVSITKL